MTSYAAAPPGGKLPALISYKAKIVHRFSLRMNYVMLDTSTQDTMDGEEPILFHNLKMT